MGIIAHELSHAIGQLRLVSLCCSLISDVATEKSNFVGGPIILSLRLITEAVLYDIRFNKSKVYQILS